VSLFGCFAEKANFSGANLTNADMESGGPAWRAAPGLPARCCHPGGGAQRRGSPREKVVAASSCS
jgi:hypothetical protein